MSPLDQLYETLVQSAAAEAERRVVERLKLTPIDRTLDLHEAAEYMRLSESTLRKMCREKTIPHQKYGAVGSKNPRYLFSTVSLDKWKHEQEELNYHPQEI